MNKNMRVCPLVDWVQLSALSSVFSVTADLLPAWVGRSLIRLQSAAGFLPGDVKCREMSSQLCCVDVQIRKTWGSNLSSMFCEINTVTFSLHRTLMYQWDDTYVQNKYIYSYWIVIVRLTAGPSTCRCISQSMYINLLIIWNMRLHCA